MINSLEHHPQNINKSKKILKDKFLKYEIPIKSEPCDDEKISSISIEKNNPKIRKNFKCFDTEENYCISPSSPYYSFTNSKRLNLTKTMDTTQTI